MKSMIAGPAYKRRAALTNGSRTLVGRIRYKTDTWERNGETNIPLSSVLLALYGAYYTHGSKTSQCVGRKSARACVINLSLKIGEVGRLLRLKYY